MCNQGPRIKFCSCDTETLEPAFPYWVLYREVGKSRLEIVGLFLPPEELTALDQITIQGISDALNAGDSFDFNYDPKPNDMFVLHLAEDNRLMFSCEDDYAEDGELIWSYDIYPMLYNEDFKQIDSGKLVNT